MMETQTEIAEYVKALSVITVDKGEYLFEVDPIIYKQYVATLPLSATYL